MHKDLVHRVQTAVTRLLLTVLCSGMNHAAELTFHGAGPKSTPTRGIRPPSPGFNISDPEPQVEENAGQLEVYVTRSTSERGPATVDYFTSDLTAKDGKDYVATSGTLHFAPTDSFQTFSIPILNNTLQDSNRVFQVTLRNPSPGSALGETTVATATILDNEIGFHWLDANPSVSENAGEAVLTVFREGDFPGTASIDYRTEAGTAAAGTDFTPVSGTLTFGPDEQYKLIRIPITNDSIPERDESFRLVLFNPLGSVPLATPASATVQIIDNDTGYQFDSGQYYVSETNGVQVVRVTRGPDFGAGTVDYKTVPGTAVANKNYRPMSGTLHFAAGEDSQDIQIQILEDSSVLPDATFQIQLSNPSGGTPLGDIQSATVQIQDYEIGFHFAGDVIVDETDGFAHVHVLRQGNFGPATVDFATEDDSATAGQDYTAVKGTLSFGMGETDKQIDIPILNDAQAEGPESFRVVLSNPSAGVPLGPPQTINVNIQDNDIGFAMHSDSVSVHEADGFAVLRIDRLGEFGSGTVEYATQPGTAIPGLNYIPVHGTAVFGPTDRFQYVKVPILFGDVGDEGATFDVLLQDSGPGIPIGDPAITTVQIQPSAHGFGFDSADYSINEADGPLLIPVTRFGNFGPGTVDFFTVPVTATPGADYTPVSGTLTFAAEEVVQFIQIPTVNDSLSEPEETLSVVLTNATGGVPLSGLHVATVHIQDNDLGYSVTGPDGPVHENDGTAVFKVVRKGDYNFSSAVEYVAVMENANAGESYPPVSGTLTFSPNQTEHDIPIPLMNDSSPTSSRYYRFLLHNPSNGVPIQTGFDQATLFVQEDDLGYRLEETDPGLFLVTEKTGQVEIRVYRDGSFGVASTVDFEVSANGPGYGLPDGTAVPGVDFVPTTGTLRFGPKDTVQPLTFTLLDNAQFDPDRTFWIRLLNASPEVPIQFTYPPGARQIVIRDDEQNPMRIDPDFIAAVPPDACDDRHSSDWLPQFDGQGRILFTKARASFDGRDGTTVIRLLPTGALDPSFRIPLFDTDVFLQRVQPDGKLLVTIGSQFARLNADGTIDSSFRPLLPAPESSVNGVILEPDGGMIVGTTGGTPVSWTLLKLQADGALDHSFQQTRADTLLWPIFRQPTGAILTVTAQGDTIRFRPDGTRDPHFIVPYTSFPIAFQSDGGLLYGTDPILRLTPEGEPDSSFLEIDHPRALACAADNSVWVLRSGDASQSFYPPQTNGLARLEHLHSDGTPDTNWPSALIELGQRFCSDALTLTPSGNLLLSGSFQRVNGQVRHGIAQLLVNSPSVRLEIAPQSAALAENSGTNSIAVLRVGDHTQPLTVQWSLGSASAIQDVHFKSGSGLLNFGPGEYERSIPIVVIDDPLPNPDRSLRVHLSDVQAQALPDLELTIANDDLGFAAGSIRRFSNGRIWLQPTGQTLRTGDVTIEFSDDLQNWEPMNPIGSAPGVLDLPDATVQRRFYRVTGE